MKIRNSKFEIRNLLALLLLLAGSLLAAPNSLRAAAPCIKHAFTSAKSDAADATLIRASDWNACHTVDDASISAAKLSFDPATQAELDAALALLAPASAKYILQQAVAGLPNAQALGALVTGILKNTTTSGLLSIAVAGTDYEFPLTFSLPLTRSTNAIGCQLASGSQAGCLSSTDWTTFNAKLPAGPPSAMKSLAITPAQIDNAMYNKGGFTVIARDGTRFVVTGQSSADAYNAGSIISYKSVDGGRTWTGPTTLVSDATFGINSVGGGILPNGRIVLIYYRYTLTTGVPVDAGTRYSDDNFASLSAYTTFSLQGMTSVGFNGYGPVSVLDNGTVVLSWSGNNGTDYTSHIIKSTDNGATFPVDVQISSILTGQEVVCEAVGGNTLLCLARHVGVTNYRQYLSVDGGATWIDQGATAWGGVNPTSIWLSKYIDSAGIPMLAAVYTSTGALLAQLGPVKDVIAGVAGWPVWAVVGPIAQDFAGNSQPSFVMVNDSPRLFGWYADTETASNASINFINYSLPDSIYGIQRFSHNSTYLTRLGVGGNFDPIYDGGMDIRNASDWAGYGFSDLNAGAPTAIFPAARGFAILTKASASNLGVFLLAYSKSTSQSAIEMLGIINGEPTTAGAYPVKIRGSQRSGTSITTVAAGSNLIGFYNQSILAASILGDGTLTALSFNSGAPAGGTSGTWKLGVAAAVSPTAPNRTIEVDIGGTIYYLAAKTTNN